jgi:hypothetical protein
VQVTDISKHRLVILFIEGLEKTLHGWVKTFNPTTLQDVIMKTLDMKNTVPKMKGPIKLPNPTFLPNLRITSHFGKMGPRRILWMRRREGSSMKEALLHVQVPLGAGS